MIHVVLLAAGKSERFGKPKLLEKIGDTTVLEMSLKTLQKCDVVDDIVLVTSGLVMDYALKVSKQYSKISKVLKGGKTRRESSRIGIRDLPDNDAVLIHDAARPFATCELFRRVVERMNECRAVIPVVNLRDTVAVIEKNEILEIPSREKLRAVQTPQGFSVNLIRSAHEKNNSEVTDDSKLVLNIGERVCFVEGEITNLKITFPIDLLFAKVIFFENPKKFDR